jgi:hypothetical protein
MVKSHASDKKELSFYLELLCNVYSDVADASPAQHRTEIARDLMRIRSRVEHEGISFLTKALPSLCKAVDKALASGTVLQTPHFSRRKGSSIPKLFGVLLDQVFGSDGVELLASSSIALGHFRHLTLMFYKLELPFSDESVERVLDEFITTDSQLQQNWTLTNEDKHTLRGAEKLVSRLLANTDPSRVNPRHGPGAVATRERQSEKAVFSRIFRSVEEVYPFGEYFFFSPSHLCDRLRTRSVDLEENVPNGDFGLRGNAPPRSHRGRAGVSNANSPNRGQTLLSLSTVQWPEILEHGTARVVLVPKDSRGPRLISMEPLEIQWLQQGQKDVLVNALESHPLSKGQINFLNQEVNRSLALEASRHGNLVTLDMKEASDRVSTQLVHTLLPLNWIRALESTRSPETELPCGRILVLNKFAPMGSAVCFPLEALCFWALAVSCLMTKYPYSSMREIAKTVWVYGDDIITYRKDYPEVMQFMEKVGLKFNLSKCCTSGFFRESCGLDAHKGVIVTPVRITKRWCCHLVVPNLVSYIEYSNALFDRGYYKAAAYIEECVQHQTRIPYTREKTSGPCFVRPWADTVKLNHRRGIRMRFNAQLHRLECFGWTVRAKTERSTCDGWEELLRTLSTRKRLLPTVMPRSAEQPRSLRDWALHLRKEEESAQQPVAGLYSLRRRVTSKRRWFALR